MSTSASIAETSRSTSWMARTRDFVELCKPRIATLVLLVVIASGFVATFGQANPLALLNVSIGAVLVAASASASNHWLEQHRDARMRRTQLRPIVAGRVQQWEALTFIVVTLIAGVSYLSFTVGMVSTIAGILTWVLYVLIYTPMKIYSPTNTAVGAVAGAMPVIIGWGATGAELDWRCWALFLTLFLWQFPHFMAIAWIYREQYGRAGMRMLTVVDPSGVRAGIQAILAAIAVIPVSVLPLISTPTPWAVSGVAIVALLGLAQLALAMWFAWRRDDISARILMRGTLIYLPLVLLVIVVFPLL